MNKKIDLKEQYRNILENMDERARYLIFAALLLCVFTLDYLILMRPQLKSLTKIGPEIKILSEDIQTAKTDKEKVEEYRAEVKELEQYLDAAFLRVPPKEEMSRIIEHVSRVANKYELKIGQVKPLLTDQQKLSENQGKIFFKIPIFIEARGSYHNIGRFFADLEQGAVFVDVESFSIKSSVASPQLQDLQMRLDAIVFDKK